MQELFVFVDTGKLILYQNNWESPGIAIRHKKEAYFLFFVNESKVFEVYKHFFDFKRRKWESLQVEHMAGLPISIKAILLIKGVSY